MKYYRTNTIIKKEKVRENPDVLYLFGDNDLRRGLGGQAKEMRYEPNTLGISTKKVPSNDPSAFKTDNEFEENVLILQEDFKKVHEAILSGKYKAIVIPPIGVGLAKLPLYAPKTYAVLERHISLVKVMAENFYKK